jgi:monothiol glutaredoxin
MNQTQATPQASDVAADSQPNALREQIREAIAGNDVILFMKGTPEAPACGFSARTVASLEAVGTAFASVDVLADPRIRQELSALSNWPTIPQLFVSGELVGGCDIVTEMYDSGELAQLLGAEDAAAGAGTAGGGGAGEPAVPATGFTPVENHLG